MLISQVKISVDDQTFRLIRWLLVLGSARSDRILPPNIPLNMKQSLFLFVAIFLTGNLLQAQLLNQSLIEALAANSKGSASASQKALLFKHNETINKAALIGEIPDDVYQKAQLEFDTKSQQIASRAARDAGAKFTVQERTSATFAPGTDSDYITQVDSEGQVRQMQDGYNRGVNEYLKEHKLLDDGPKSNWHNTLDVDFMADPDGVTQATFEEIAKANNDAYTRKLAADYERKSRAKNAAPLQPEHYREYVKEMEDFIEKKNKKLQDYYSNPEKLSDPNVKADYHRLIAQEQKYISRIEATEMMLRQQQGLPPRNLDRSAPVYEIFKDAEGNEVGRRVYDPNNPPFDGPRVASRSLDMDSLAKRAAKRSASNFSKTATGHAVAANSQNRALMNLADAMAEAAEKNPDFRLTSARDIAVIAEKLPPNQKGQLLDRLAKRNQGSIGQEARLQAEEFSRQVAREMKTLKGAPPPRIRAASMRARLRELQKTTEGLDEAARKMVGMSEDLGKMGGARAAFNKSVQGAMAPLSAIGVGSELWNAKVQLGQYFDSIGKALDPNTPEEEAQRLFDAAMDNAESLIGSAALGTLFELFPTTGAAFGAWQIGYHGGGYVLQNTAVGKNINRAAGNFFDRQFSALDRAGDDLEDLMGGKSQRTFDEETIQALLARYQRGIDEGHFRFIGYFDMSDVEAYLRAGLALRIRGELIEDFRAVAADKKEAEEEKKKEEEEAEVAKKEEDEAGAEQDILDKMDDELVAENLSDAITEIMLTEPDPAKRERLIQEAIARITGYAEETGWEASGESGWEESGNFAPPSQIDAWTQGIAAASGACNYIEAKRLADLVLQNDPENAWVKSNYEQIVLWSRKSQIYNNALSQAYAALDANQLEVMVSHLNTAMQNAASNCGQDAAVQSLLSQAASMAEFEREQAIAEAKLEGREHDRELRAQQARAAAADKERKRRAAGFRSALGGLVNLAGQAAVMKQGGLSDTQIVEGLAQQTVAGSDMGRALTNLQGLAEQAQTIQNASGTNSGSTTIFKTTPSTNSIAGNNQASAQCQSLYRQAESIGREIQSLSARYQAAAGRDDIESMKAIATQIQSAHQRSLNLTRQLQAAGCVDFSSINVPGMGMSMEQLLNQYSGQR